MSEISARSIWIMEFSADGGKSWEMSQSHGIYKTQARAEARANKENIWHSQHLSPAAWCYGRKFRAQEYVPISSHAAVGA
jgi:hypothetical protein